jgi:DNA-binding response OmpR family regulator
MAEHILVIEDDPQIADLLRRGLIYEGYSVKVAAEGAEGLAAARDRAPDLVLLDLMLPGMDGLTVCQRLRAAGDVPIIILTAKDAVPDRVKGLDAGADDYVVKPFAFDELLARIRALLRRRQPAAQEDVLRFADLAVNPVTHEVYRGNRRVDLTAREFEMLHLFAQHPRQVITRDTLYDRIWGYDFGGESNIIEVYIRYLRSKLEEGGEPRLLQTVRGVGYALREE